MTSPTLPPPKKKGQNLQTPRAKWPFSTKERPKHAYASSEVVILDKEKAEICIRPERNGHFGQKIPDEGWGGPPFLPKLSASGLHGFRTKNRDSGHFSGRARGGALSGFGGRLINLGFGSPRGCGGGRGTNGKGKGERQRQRQGRA